MVNPVTSKSHFERFILGQCCFFFTLRAGSLIIGLLELLFGILWLIGGVSRAQSGYTGLISTVLLIVAGVLVILAIKKENSKYMWHSVYINIVIVIWLIIFIIIMFATLLWGMAVGGIVNGLIIIYFTSVLRSYAFEIEAGPAQTNPA